MIDGAVVVDGVVHGGNSPPETYESSRPASSSTKSRLRRSGVSRVKDLDG